jgi:trans-feruloyl-CoA hydratase/vanillin synthase
MSKLETLLVSTHDAIATVTMNRPRKRNAISPTMLHEMLTTFELLEADPAVRVVVLRGAEGVFSAGMDLKEYFRDAEHDEFLRNRNRRMFTDITVRNLGMFPKPTIASVAGYCFGGAFQLVTACDIAVAANEATFGLSEVNWGRMPAGMVSKVVSDFVGLRRALYWALTGFTFDGQAAATAGLVSESVPGEHLEARTVELARHLSRLDPSALRATKEALRQVGPMSNEQASWWLMSKTRELASRQEQAGVGGQGLTSFLEGTYRPGLQSYTEADPEPRA